MTILACGLVACGRVGFDDVAPTDATSMDTRRFCERQDGAFFCEDFDHPEGPMGWDSNPLQTDISYDDVALSPPLAMHITMAPGSASCRYRRLDNRQNLSESVSAVTLAWAFRLGPMGADPGFTSGTIAQLIVRGMPGVQQCVLLVRAAPGATSQINEQNIMLGGGFFGEINDIPVPIQSERYVRAELAITLGSSPRYSLTIDDMPAIVDEPMEPECAGRATGFETNMGLHCYPADTMTVDVRYDDIVVTISP